MSVREYKWKLALNLVQIESSSSQHPIRTRRDGPYFLNAPQKSWCVFPRHQRYVNPVDFIKNNWNILNIPKISWNHTDSDWIIITLISSSVWKSALTNALRRYEINSWVLFGTLRVANIKSFLMWKSWTFSISLLKCFGLSSKSFPASMKITDDESRTM